MTSHCTIFPLLASFQLHYTKAALAFSRQPKTQKHVDHHTATPHILDHTTCKPASSFPTAPRKGTSTPFLGGWNTEASETTSGFQTSGSTHASSLVAIPPLLHSHHPVGFPPTRTNQLFRTHTRSASTERVSAAARNPSGPLDRQSPVLKAGMLVESRHRPSTLMTGEATIHLQPLPLTRALKSFILPCYLSR